MLIVTTNTIFRVKTAKLFHNAGFLKQRVTERRDGSDLRHSRATGVFRGTANNRKYMITTMVIIIAGTRRATALVPAKTASRTLATQPSLATT